MPQQLKWFQRTFDFSFPAGLFPSILERLRGTPARLEDLARLYPLRIFTMRADSGWTMQEHAGHLYDLDELHEQRLDDYLAGKAALRPADLANTKTVKANHNAASLDAVLRNFRSARQHFVYRLSALDDRILERTAVHPRLNQPMRLVDMAYFVAEHDDHHIARMTALARKFLRED